MLSQKPRSLEQSFCHMAQMRGGGRGRSFLCSWLEPKRRSAGRWSAEKRIHLLWEALPKARFWGTGWKQHGGLGECWQDCALVIVGDGTSGYCQTVMDAPTSGQAQDAKPFMLCFPLLSRSTQRTPTQKDAQWQRAAQLTWRLHRGC